MKVVLEITILELFSCVFFLSLLCFFFYHIRNELLLLLRASVYCEHNYISD